MKSKHGLGAYYAIRLGNRSGLFHSSRGPQGVHNCHGCL